MNRKFTELSQLKVGVVKIAEPKKEPPVKSMSNDQEVLDYFGLGKHDDEPVQEKAVAEPKHEEVELALSASREKLADKDAEIEAAREKIEELEREVERLKARLHDLECSENIVAPGQEDMPADMPAGVSLPDSMEWQREHSILLEPDDFAEAFPGEMREMLIAALADALNDAKNGSRQRRASVLSAVLAKNQSSGALERRRAELRQILKDSGYYNDPKALEGLGFRLISGRNHWKLEYADVRIVLSKTPSDYRANINTAVDVANRCF